MLEHEGREPKSRDHTQQIEQNRHGRDDDAAKNHQQHEKGADHDDQHGIRSPTRQHMREVVVLRCWTANDGRWSGWSEI